MRARRRKLLFIVFSYSDGGGAEKVLSSLLRQIVASSQYDIDVLECFHCATGFETIPDGVRLLPPVVDRTAASLGSKVKAMVKRAMLYRLTPLVRRVSYRSGQYDAVIAWNAQTASFLLPRRGRTISWVHGTLSIEEYGAKAIARQRETFKRAGRVVAISNNTARSVVRLFPECEEKLRVVYNGFRFNEIEAKAHGESGIVAKAHDIVSVGHLDGNKDPLAILDAFELILVRHPDARLFFAGDGPLRRALEIEIVQRELTECVFVLGFVDNPYPLIKQSSCLLSLSHTEGFQSVLVEGLYLGVPFVSSRCGSAEELSGAGRFGAVVDSVDEVPSAYERMTGKRAAVGYSGEMSSFVRKYDISGFAESFERVLMEVLGL